MSTRRLRSRRCDTRRSMEGKNVLFEVSDRIATITLNRPDRLNAINKELRDELREAWMRVKQDPDIWCAIVTGAGRGFSTGADVEKLATGGLEKRDRWNELSIHERLKVLPFPRRLSVHKPVIAAVNGVT